METSMKRFRSFDEGGALTARQLAIVILVGNSVVPLSLYAGGCLSGWGCAASILFLLSSAKALALHNDDGTLKF
jgi:hypothetical protein